MGGGVYWEGGVIWLWCKWGMDWRRGCGKIRGGKSGCGARDEKWWWLGAPGSESLRSGQKNGLDLRMSNNFISMGGIGGGRNRTNCGTMLYA